MTSLPGARVVPLFWSTLGDLKNVWCVYVLGQYLLTRRPIIGEVSMTCDLKNCPFDSVCVKFGSFTRLSKNK